MVKTSVRWTEEEIQIMESHKGRVSDLIPKLPGRAYDSIRRQRSKLKQSKPHTPWTKEEDTILRETPATNRAEFFREKFPHKSYYVCYQRYETFIAPLLGLSKMTKPRTKLDNHLKLARTDQERENLRRFFEHE